MVLPASVRNGGRGTPPQLGSRGEYSGCGGNGFQDRRPTPRPRPCASAPPTGPGKNGARGVRKAEHHRWRSLIYGFLIGVGVASAHHGQQSSDRNVAHIVLKTTAKFYAYLGAPPNSGSGRVVPVVAGRAARSGWLAAIFWLRSTTTRPEVVHRFTMCVFAHSPQSQKNLLGKDLIANALSSGRS